MPVSRIKSRRQIRANMHNIKPFIFIKRESVSEKERKSEECERQIGPRCYLNNEHYVTRSISVAL